jgi:hypothetical protein
LRAEPLDTDASDEGKATAPEIVATILSEPYPCDTCRQARACAQLRLACQAFTVYVHGAPEGPWVALEGSPTRDAWERMFDPGGEGSARGGAACAGAAH